MTGLFIFAGVPWQGAVLTALLFLHLFSLGPVIAGPWVLAVTEVIGLRRKDARHTALARELSQLLTIMLSVATVLGVGALLFITIYLTDPFVTAATHFAWGLLGVIPLLMCYAAMTYLHLFTWHTFPWPRWHVAPAVLAGLTVLLIPLVFSAIATLMRHPGWWWAALPLLPVVHDPTYALRYLHVLGAALAVTGTTLLFYGWVRRRRAPEPPRQAYYQWVMRAGGWWAFAGVLAQLGLGLALLYALPGGIRQTLLGGNSVVTILFMTAIALAFVTLVLLGIAQRTRFALSGALAFAAIFLVFGLMIVTRSQVRNAYYQGVRVPIFAPQAMAGE